MVGGEAVRLGWGDGRDVNEKNRRLKLRSECLLWGKVLW